MQNSVLIYTERNDVRRFFRAAETGQIDILKQMVEDGFNLNTRSISGHTPLMESAIGNQFEATKFLVDKGANINLIKEIGWTALTAALFNADDELVLFLISKGANCDTSPRYIGLSSLMIAAMRGRSSLINPLIEKGLQVNENDKNGDTPLIHAARGDDSLLGGDPETVKILLEANATIDWRNNDGRTALCYASEFGDIETVKALLDKGATLNLADDDGLTPLMIAAFYGKQEIVEYLLMRGANIHLKNNEKKTAAQLAQQGGYHDLSLFLNTYQRSNK